MLDIGMLTQLECGNNFSYVLEDGSLFSNTDYKIMQSNDNGPFIKCVRIKLNGKTQLYYLCGGFRPLATLLPQLTPDLFVAVVENIIYSIKQVKDNGFLKVENLDISPEHIFIDPVTNKVYFLYLPISKTLAFDELTLENDLRALLVKILLGVEGLSSPRTMQLLLKLQNATIPFVDILTEENLESDVPKKKQRREFEKNELRLIVVNRPEKQVFVVNKDSYVLGRSDKHADGVVCDERKMVGRTHCLIERTTNGYKIKDLGSTNGSSLNREKMDPEIWYEIHNGDLLRIANIEMKIQM